jgi:hypothetical protein
MKNIAPITTIAIIVAIFVCVPSLLDRAERAECHKWQAQAEEFQSFHLAEWQKAQCEHHQISVFQGQ